MVARRSRVVCSLLIVLLLAPGLGPAAHAAPPTPNERFAHLIGRPITMEDPAFHQHLVRLLDQSDRDRKRGRPESVWRKTREDAVLAVLTRNESQEFVVENSFHALLRRPPSAKELKSVRQTVNGKDTREVIQRLASSDEYFHEAGGATNAGFVAAVFRDIVKRDVEPGSAAALLAQLVNRVPRSKIVAHLLAGREYRERLVRDLYRSRGLGEPDAARLADGLALLERSDGYRRLLARVLASDAYFQVALAPPPPVLGPAGGGLPLPPEITIASAWSAVPTVPPGDFDTLFVTASPDGSLWRVGRNNVFVYAALQGTWSQVSLPPQVGAIQVLAPLSATQAWVAGQEGGAFGLLDASGSLTQYPGPAECTNGSCLQSISATALPSRGVLWALTTANNVYTFNPSAPNGQQWTLIPSGGFLITSVSGAGAASGAVDGYALAGSQALQHSSAGWTPVAYLAGTTIVWIQGCADGSAWALTNINADLAQIRPGGAWNLISAGLKVTVMPPSTDASQWTNVAAVSMNRLYATFLPADFLRTFRYRYSALSIGVVNQPPTPFPPMTPGQQAAYNAISQGLGVTVPGGVRTQYTGVSGVETYLSNIGGLHNPGIDPTDWNTMIQQITTELTYVVDVSNLFNNGISVLNTQIDTVVTPLLSPAAQVVGLTTQDQQASVGLFFADMFATVFSDVVGSFGVPGAIAGGVLGSMLGAAVNALFPSVPPLDPLVQAYSQLATNISNIFQTVDGLTETYLSTIVQDWGMLSRVGGLLNSGQWQLSYGELPALAAATENSFDVSFYQALFPAKWQIVNTLYGDYVQYPWTATPGYDTYAVPCPSCNQYGFPVENLWFANLLGNPADLNGDLSPFPQELLFDTLGELNVDFDDFWRSQNGWTTTQVTATTN